MTLVSEIDPLGYRRADRAIDPRFLKRWSPRAMSGEPISDAELMTLFEAARWAPSSYNEQPWRFFYARRGGPHWDTFFGFLTEMNQKWTKNAAVLLALASKRTFSANGKPNKVHTFDAGAAWENLALQATHMGLVAHGMAGFDDDRAQRGLRLPDDFKVEAMIAIGKPGNVEDLPDGLRERESPSDRKAVSEFVCEGPFKA